ncbi:MAG: preprotein translocase subunit SecA [Kiritimatiellaceae bacterium]|nr:MAG: preprotein translocase subunit SecA [Kiritimatiellaceae bacterium]|tara:strand:- start:865 stop:3894 length:3030 start_codon:yes stop_codon:yes gene_type:complete
MNWILKKIVGSKNERDLKKMGPKVEQIKALDEQYKSLTDEQLQSKTGEFKDRLAAGATLEEIEAEAFAVVKNAARRLCGTTVDVCGHGLPWEMVHFDVQLIGGMAIHNGMIAEMATGEGKTLVATLPVYLNALTGKGVHVVTTSDYHSQRDSEWMGHLYTWLGLTVGCLKNMMPPPQRREMYLCDITYGTNSEFGFDYLRDNMAYTPEDMVQQKGHHFAIVDEIDSILIDEARTPLIISGPAPYSSTQYSELQPAAGRLVRRQRDLCTQLLKEAKTLLDQHDEDQEEASLKLYQVFEGMPKNKQLMHLIEDINIRKLLEKTQMKMLSDAYKETARELRQELFFTIDEKGHDASLTEKGCAELNPNDPEMYVLPDMVAHMSELDGRDDLSPEELMEKRRTIQDDYAMRNERIHAVDQLIRAHTIYEKDVDYVVQDNQVVIVDEHTGRLMTGRRWSDGLHQAVEAKEGVKIERETQTLATVTIQNYFRMYEKLSGMTGTAETEADEFHQIYGLDVMVIPTNRPVRRLDLNDQVYKTQREKFNAVIDEIKAANQRQQPVLVGTVAVETSEVLSRMLRRENIIHNVLNAKNHAREAEIVANAGQPGAVTIATNMAGRGTDIKLGPSVVHLNRDDLTSTTFSLDSKVDGKPLRKLLEERPCGLYVIASERHESRRIDRQLRGRSARQGDPGLTRFYVSLEDNLMRLFGSEKISGIMEKLGIEEGEVLEHPWLNRSIETAQRRVEQQNFMMRKRTLEYDDVMNAQRTEIYSFRSEALQAEDPRDQLLNAVEQAISSHAADTAVGTPEALQEFLLWVNTTFPLGLNEEELPAEKTPEALTAIVMEQVQQAYTLKASHESTESLKRLERHLILQAIDQHWQEYLRNMDSLRESIGLRAYGQRDPLVEYKREAYNLFMDLMERIYEEIATSLFRSATSVDAMQDFFASLAGMQMPTPASALAAGGQPASPQQIPPPGAGLPPGMDAPAAPRRETAKVGRNDPCPCGSGRKFKKCCGAE